MTTDTKATFTPGPWTLRPLDTDNGRMITAQAFDGSEKAIVRQVRGGTADEADANARLIAAAPDLLAALTGADIDQIIEGIELFVISDMAELREIWQPSIDKLNALKAAIAKAEGGV